MQQYRIMLVIIVSLVLFALVWSYCQTRGGKAAHWYDAFGKLLLVLTFLVYPNVTMKTFDAFACHTLSDGISYLKVDYSIMCQGADIEAVATYKTFLILPLSVLLLFVLGFPAIVAVLLYRNRQLILHTNPHSSHAFDFITSDYRLERYWFEV